MLELQLFSQISNLISEFWQKIRGRISQSPFISFSVTLTSSVTYWSNKLEFSHKIKNSRFSSAHINLTWGFLKIKYFKARAAMHLLFKWLLYKIPWIHFLTSSLRCPLKIFWGIFPQISAAVSTVKQNRFTLTFWTLQKNKVMKWNWLCPPG